MMERTRIDNRGGGGRKGDSSPITVAAGGALVGAGMGGGVPGAIIGGIIGWLAGSAAQKEDKDRGAND